MFLIKPDYATTPSYKEYSVIYIITLTHIIYNEPMNTTYITSVYSNYTCHGIKSIFETQWLGELTTFQVNRDSAVQSILLV
jgi:hypothetical protein